MIDGIFVVSIVMHREPSSYRNQHSFYIIASLLELVFLGLGERGAI